MPLVATKGAASAQGFGEFAQQTAANFIEDVFSTYLYTGTGATQTITNNIDLAGKGGMVWTKSRSAVRNNNIVDTVRGGDNMVYTNDTTAQFSLAGLGYSPFTFSSTGFVESDAPVNAQSGATFCSWTFRKQAKFFDVVTFTSDASNTNQRISHNLGSTPGCIFVKRTSSGDGWFAWHRSYASATDNYQFLNTTQAVLTSANVWGSTGPSSTDFGINTTVFGGSATFVAYIFAHDAGGFGTAGTDNVISCGSVTTDGSGAASVTLGYEPQWVLLKNSQAAENWQITDIMRGMPVGSADALLLPNSSAAESSYDDIDPTATGFNLKGLNSSQTYIYMAIRRGPMKTPTSGTSVFEPTVRTGTGTSNQSISGLAFPPDLVITRNRPSNLNDKSVVFDKLRGSTKYLITSGSDAEATGTTSLTSFNQTGETFGDAGIVNGNGDSYINWQFCRASGFFDEVCYTGTGSATTFTHNLGVVPELMIVKRRNDIDSWFVYHANNTGSPATQYLELNATAATSTYSGAWNNTVPTSSVFTVGSNSSVSASTYVAYLFATCAGVSKVGSYTGNGSNLTIPCGFTAGARFVLIKRTSSTGDWYVWDSARGINPSTDPHLSLNTIAAEVTTDDSVDADNSGFIVNQLSATDINVNSATYIFLAIA